MYLTADLQQAHAGLVLQPGFCADGYAFGKYRERLLRPALRGAQPRHRRKREKCRGVSFAEQIATHGYAAQYVGLGFVVAPQGHQVTAEQAHVPGRVLVRALVKPLRQRNRIAICRFATHRIAK